MVAGADLECVAGSVKDLNCVAWRLKLTGKAEVIPKELLVDEGEDPQVAIETKEIEEPEIYDRIKADMDRLPENKRKELRQHIQGILRENVMAHRHAAEAVDHLAESVVVNARNCCTISSNSTTFDWGTSTPDEHIPGGS